MEFHDSQNQNTSSDVFQEILNEFELSKRSLIEVNLMLEQSRVELGKLTQRNSSIAGHLQQVQSQFESIPRSDIRMAYNAALDSQQRLLVMRSQLEKLQTDQSYLQKMIALLDKVKKMSSENSPVIGGHDARSSAAVLEMVIDAQESERQKLSKQMHDGPAQALSNFIVQTEIAARYFEADPAKAKDELNKLKTSAMSTFQKVRDFIFDLRPMMLDDLGLFPTIRRFVASYKEQSGSEINLVIQGQERRLEPFLEVMIFRAVQELMENAAVHNQENAGKLQVDIKIYVEDNLVKVSLSDNGKGFKPEEISEQRVGIKLIRERVEMSGGFLEIDSAIGKGSKISFQIPVQEHSA
jgi:two-component system, NarL family, sensor histidine kinase DegS